MGEHSVHDTSDQQRTRIFVRAMLDDIRALEQMIADGVIESGVSRVGVEQEMYIVDAAGYPAGISDRLLARIGAANFSTELARFNLEANLDPIALGGDFLGVLERDLKSALRRADEAAAALGARIVLAGILPTLKPAHVGHDNLTPETRYRCLNDTCMAARGDRFTLVIDGIDPLEMSFDSIVVEGASTSFQFHLQVDSDAAGHLYNLAQLITAPLLALSANSPVLLNRRAWHETRVALFERSIEYRSAAERARGVPTRVGFGEAWVKDSIVEVFRENAMRHHVIMVRDPVDDPFAALRENRAPDLGALTLHNGTVWRWNRPCYGITDGRPHLRIENRALPAGPTVVDQVANAALFYGLMASMADGAAAIPQRLDFEDARANLFAAAQHGLAARFTWLDGERIGARKLLRKRLIPSARDGLASLSVPAEDIDRYLGILDQRAENGRTGARWLLDSLANLSPQEREAVCLQAVEVVHARQGGDQPVHRWDAIGTAPVAHPPRDRLCVADIMTTNLFTARPEDLVDLATSTMAWRHVRHVPVENQAGELVGLLSTRELLHLRESGSAATPVGGIMQTDPPTIAPETPLADAFAQMLENETGCLLVIASGQLVGIVTERDLLEAAVELIP